MTTSLLDGPPTQEQIDTIGQLLVERENVYSLAVVAAKSKTMRDAGFMIRGLRNCPKRRAS
jgi:hypothetical protein